MHQSTVLCTLMMPDQHHHNHTKHMAIINRVTVIILIIQNILWWYWPEGKTAHCYMGELQHVWVHTFEAKVKILFNL